MKDPTLQPLVGPAVVMLVIAYLAGVALMKWLNRPKHGEPRQHDLLMDLLTVLSWIGLVLLLVFGLIGAVQLEGSFNRFKNQPPF